MTLTGTMPDTRAFTRREWRWVPTVPGEGVLVLRQRRHTGGAEDAAVYGVEETTAENSPVRTFLVLNVTDDDAPDAYEVAVRGGVAVGCTCKAAKCRVPVCRHRDAVVAILNTPGGL